jgi:glycosyltransferase involved in cell wall biosynthesis
MLRPLLVDQGKMKTEALPHNQRSLRILQIFSRYLQPGGEERFAELFSSALSPQHRVENYIGSTHDLLGSGGLKRLISPFLALHNPRVDHDLRALQKQKNFDVWVVQNTLPGLSPAVYRVAQSLNIPIVHYLHNFRLSCANGFFLNHGSPCERCLQGNFWPAFQTACWRDSRWISGWMGLLLRRVRSLGTFQFVRAWVALNEQQRQKHVQMGIPKNRIHVIPHFFTSANQPPDHAPAGDVLFLGRLSPEKGLDLLLQAWKQVRQDGRVLRIAGTGPAESYLRNMASSLNLANVEFLGFVSRDRHPELWRQAAFSVIPSTWNEPFPLSFLESWSQQRAPVASRLGAMAENISDGQDGLLVEPFSATSLAVAIQSLIDQPDRAIRMGFAGRQKVISRFNRDLWTQRINHVFTVALSADSPPPAQSCIGEGGPASL